VLLKRNQERMVKAGRNLNLCPPPRRTNMHDIEAYVDFDSIVDYAVSKHEVHFDDWVW
jgi:L-rhamnose isomerase